jgi:hypothetical protein
MPLIIRLLEEHLLTHCWVSRHICPVLQLIKGAEDLMKAGCCCCLIASLYSTRSKKDNR